MGNKTGERFDQNSGSPFHKYSIPKTVFLILWSSAPLEATSTFRTSFSRMNMVLKLELGKICFSKVNVSLLPSKTIILRGHEKQF